MTTVLRSQLVKSATRISACVQAIVAGAIQIAVCNISARKSQTAIAALLQITVPVRLQPHAPSVLAAPASNRWNRGSGNDRAYPLPRDCASCRYRDAPTVAALLASLHRVYRCCGGTLLSCCISSHRIRRSILANCFSHVINYRDTNNDACGKNNKKVTGKRKQLAVC